VKHTGPGLLSMVRYVTSSLSLRKALVIPTTCEYLAPVMPSRRPPLALRLLGALLRPQTAYPLGRR
jgi:hypothetical protein